MANPKLLICDKDFTLIFPASGNKFVQHPHDQILLPGVEETIARYHADGWTIAIASNQGGCEAIDPATGKPYKTIEDAIEEMAVCLELLPQIKMALFCPDFEGQKCWTVSLNSYGLLGATWMKYAPFRKPNPGMIYAAWNYCGGFDWEAEKSKILFVGDRDEDRLAAEAAEVKFLWAEGWVRS